MQTFIDKYLDHKKTKESPESFWRWSAYATIAAVLRDNVYRRVGNNNTMYANIYVLFLAESGGRKGPPINDSETLLYKINNTKIISGRASVQAILDELSRAETDKLTGKIMKAGSAIFYAQELSAGIVSDPEALNILTDIYDYKSNPYKSRLRSGPCFNLDRIVFSMLTASNEAMIKPIFNSTAITGGLLARTFLITPNETREPNSLMYVDIEAEQAGFKCVLKALEEIAPLRGEFVFEEDAKEEYNSWYVKFRKGYAKHKDPSGVIGRIHTGIVKIAMILAANDVTLQVRRKHIEEAISQCLGLMPNYNAFIMGSGTSTTSKAGQIVLTELLMAKGNILSRKEIIRNHWQDFDQKILDDLISQLEAAGIVQMVASGSQINYQLTPSGKEIVGGGEVK